MAKISARSIDRNRLAKKYPFIRHRKRMTYIGSNDLIVELLTIDFNGSSREEVYYELPFVDSNFRVLISPRDTTASDSANVGLYINDAASDLSKVTVEASAPFTGKVDVVVLRALS